MNETCLKDRFEVVGRIARCDVMSVRLADVYFLHWLSYRAQGVTDL
jgi:hypothetical protein